MALHVAAGDGPVEDVERSEQRVPLARAIKSAVQWVVSTGGSASVIATTRAATSGPSGGMREGHVLSCRRPSMPSFRRPPSVFLRGVTVPGQVGRGRTA